jgi:hypothetical protein
MSLEASSPGEGIGGSASTAGRAVPLETEHVWCLLGGQQAAFGA